MSARAATVTSYPVNKAVTQFMQQNPGLLVFLSIGNPPDFDGTRHNAGHAALRHCAAKYGVTPFFENAHLELHRLAGHPRVLVGHSRTHMNTSYKAVLAVPPLEFRGYELIVVHDDIDTAPGLAKFKLPSLQQGAHGGLVGICRRVGRPFMRLRVGVGAPPSRVAGDVARYVLARPPPAERQLFETQTLAVASDIFDRLVGAVDRWPLRDEPRAPAAGRR